MSGGRSLASVKCSNHISISANIVASAVIGWPDDKLGELISQGAKPMGPQPNFGIYRRKNTFSSLPFASLLPCHNILDSLSSKPPPNPDMAKAIWDTTIQEQSLGLLSEWLSIEELNELFGEGNWSGLVRFAVLQKGAYRCIDDGSNGHNDTFEASETIHTTSAAAAAITTRRARAVFGSRLRRGLQILTGSRDMKRAYKQLAIHPEQQRFIIICVFHPERRCWVFALSYALPFGLAGAVLQFNRIPALFTAFCRRWLAIPVHHYFDDFRIIGFEFEEKIGLHLF